jgi:hypothetical protein
MGVFLHLSASSSSQAKFHLEVSLHYLFCYKGTTSNCPTEMEKGGNESKRTEKRENER